MLRSKWTETWGARRGVGWGVLSGRAAFKSMTQAVRLSGPSAHVAFMHFQNALGHAKGEWPFWIRADCYDGPLPHGHDEETLSLNRGAGAETEA